jgi:translocation and assembly module TamB
MRRILLAFFAGALIALVLIFAFLGFTPAGRRTTARLGFWTAGQLTGFNLSCGTFTGNLFTAFTCADFAVSDSDGVFLRGRELALAWRISPLFNRRLSVQRIGVADAVMTRIPEDRQQTPFKLPDWPNAKIEVEQFGLTRITMRLPDKPELCFGASGRAVIAEPVLDVDARAARCGNEGMARLLALYRGDNLRLDGSVEDDGLLASFLFGWDGAGPTRLALAGNGPLARFAGTLTASVKAGGTANFRITSAPTGRPGEIRVAADGNVTLAEGRAPSWAPAREGMLRLRAAWAEGGSITVDDGLVRWGPSEIAFDFRLDAPAQRIAGNLDAKLARLGGELALDAATLHAAIAGTPDAPTAELTYRVDALKGGPASADRVGGTASLKVEDAFATLRLTAMGEADNFQLWDELDTALGPRTNFGLGVVYQPGTGSLNVEANAKAAHAQMQFAAELDVAPQASGGGRMEIAFDERADVAGINSPGGAKLTWVVADLAGPLAGPLTVTSPVLDARGDLRVAGGAVTGRLATTRVDVARLSRATGYGFAGTPSMNVVLSRPPGGPAVAMKALLPEVDAWGLSFKDADLTLELMKAATWSGTLKGTSGSDAGPVALNADIGWSAGQPRRVAFRDSVVGGAILAGMATAPKWGGPWTGELTLSGMPAAPIGAIVGRKMSGQGTIQATLAAVGEAQTVQLDLALSHVAAEGLFTDASFAGAGSWRQGGAATARLAVSQGNDRLAFAVDGMIGARTALSVSTLDGVWSGLTFRLLAPANVTTEAGRLTLAPARLDISGGRLELAASRAGPDLTATATLAALPAKPIAALFNIGDATGRLSGNASLTYAGFTTRGTLMLTADQLSLAGAGDLQPVDVRVDAGWDGAAAMLTARATGLDDAPAELTARVPLIREPGGFMPALPAHGPVTAQLTAAARAEKLFALLPLPEHRLGGALAISLSVSGDIAAPDIAGRASLMDGSYESLALGTRLANLDLALNATPGGALDIAGTATDGGRGTFALTGRIRLGEGGRTLVDAGLQTVNADLVRTDDYVARGSANLAIRRVQTGPARITGTVTTTEVRFDLGTPLPQGVQEIEVIEVNRPPELGVVRRRQPSALTQNTELEIEIDMPGNVRVTGYGLNAEWRGRMLAAGTLAAPRVTGQLMLVRGNVELLGRNFVLNEGLVILDPALPGNARIRIAGTHTEPALTVRATAEGTPTSPMLTWSSTPALPKDEILARLYFGRASPNLTTSEAVQLAQVSSALAGFSSGGVLGLARRFTGLDVIRIEPPAATGNGGPRIAVGKYITDRVYVGGISGAEESSGALQIEVQITPNIAVQAETGTEARHAVGVTWQRDY